MEFFIEWVFKNMIEYEEKRVCGKEVDWRIKEALMVVIGAIKDNIAEQEDLISRMEGDFIMYVLSELKSTEPFMRLRACQTYGIYADIKYTD